MYNLYSDEFIFHCGVLLAIEDGIFKYSEYSYYESTNRAFVDTSVRGATIVKRCLYCFSENVGFASMPNFISVS
jgi:hypothetical protein